MTVGETSPSQGTFDVESGEFRAPVQPGSFWDEVANKSSVKQESTPTAVKDFAKTILSRLGVRKSSEARDA